MAAKKKGEKKRGPKGGIKHTPGRGHATESSPSKKNRFRKNAAKKRRDKEEAARKLWKEWEDMSPERRKLLGPKGQPKLPRPKNED